MENAKIKKLEPKEWLDRVIDNLDQLYILDNALRPEEVTYTCLDVANCGREFPQIHLGAENVRLFASVLSLPIERSEVKSWDDGWVSETQYYVELSITYRAHKIFGLQNVDIEGRELP